MNPEQQPAPVQQPPPVSPAPKQRGGHHFLGLAVAYVLALVFLGTTVWAFMGKSDAESNLDAKIASAVTAAEEAKTTELNAAHEEELKSPFNSVDLAESLGKITIEYPKSWSVYAIEKENGKKIVDLYGQPGVVPNVSGDTSFYLRMELVDDTYDEEVDDMSRYVDRGEATAKPAKSNGVTGTKIEGSLSSDKSGVMYLFPIRDKTLKLWTEVIKAESDLLKVLDSLVFQP